MEKRICAAVLKQLDDSSNDVQTIAVKCLGALLKKVQEAQVRGGGPNEVGLQLGDTEGCERTSRAGSSLHSQLQIGHSIIFAPLRQR